MTTTDQAWGHLAAFESRLYLLARQGVKVPIEVLDLMHHWPRASEIVTASATFGPDVAKRARSSAMHANNELRCARSERPFCDGKIEHVDERVMDPEGRPAYVVACRVCGRQTGEREEWTV